MSVELFHRERTDFRDEEYVIASGDSSGEWIRMHWRSDVPRARQERNSLLMDVRA